MAKRLTKLESEFQSKVIQRLEYEFPGIFILKNDSGYLQGIPDILALYEDRWVALEVKPYEDAPHEPNQDYYVELLNKMSYAAFIYPENEEEVFYDLQQALRPRRLARRSQR